MRKLYHWLGSVYFAIILIAATALFVIIGTFIESKTESHLYAAHWTYSNPLFLILLWGFFINILFSATRRWPFKKKHIPFLTTHLGLLMILSGVLIKNYFGIQGSMILVEGTGKHEIFLPETYMLHIENRDKEAHALLKDFFEPWPGLKIKKVNFAPHSTESLETWIKGEHLFITGLPPLKLQQDFLPIGTIPPRNIYAHQTDQIAEAAKAVFLHDLNVTVSDANGKVVYEGPFQEQINKIRFSLNLDYSPYLGFGEPVLIAENEGEKIKVALDGSRALENINLTSPYLGDGFIHIDLKSEPKIAFIQDTAGDVHLFAFDSYGRVHAERFDRHNLRSYIAYNEGYGGYSIQAGIPEIGKNRNEMEQRKIDFLKEQLQKALENGIQLAPPLALLNDSNQAIDFILAWHKNRNLIYSGNFKLSEIDWSRVSERDFKTCYWMTVLLPELQQKMEAGLNFRESLQAMGWPLTDQFHTLSDEEQSLELFTQQIYAVADQLPAKDASEINSEALFSAYLRLYGLQLNSILPIFEEETKEAFFLETPLTLKLEKANEKSKLEENVPIVSLLLAEDKNKDFVTLSYDRLGSGLKWPVLGGKYLMRFQPQFKEIPYRVRLRDARQINYPNSNQPYSYESDIVFTDKRTGERVEKTISMNNVYETWDGYRFYLANISPGVETSVQTIQLAVNHDPAKYVLTYPGAIILSLGILLLFWLRPYTK